MSSFHIINFGCRATQADGGEIERELSARSFSKAESVVDANLVVLNTCTVTAAADRDARQTIRRVRRENPQAKIVVTGCYAQRAPQDIIHIPGVDLVVGNSHKHQLAQIVDETMGHGRDASGGSSSGPISSSNPLSCTAEIFVEQFTRLERRPFVAHAVFAATDRTRPSLKIQDGCDANCSFCIIPSVRGRSRSLVPAEVRAQVESLVADGYTEVVLSGIHLGSYGRDLAERTSLLRLMESLDTIETPCRLRLSSIEPLEVSDEIIDHVARSQKFADHFHVPMQSGVDRILRLMRRPYTVEQYAHVIDTIRRKIPRAAIGADIIAGFPGESEAEHRATVDLIDRSSLTYLHVFSFSPRPGTPAAALGGAIDPQGIKRRSAELRALGKRKKFEFQQRMLGEVLSVVTLGPKDGNSTEAMSENFLEVNVLGQGIEANQIVDVTIETIEQGTLAGKLVEKAKRI